MLDTGYGPPLVLVPGLQGRWEWMRPAIDALALRFRVLTFSLAGDKGSERSLPLDANFDPYVDQIDAALDDAGEPSATICGISFGGLIAFRYARQRRHRVRQLILASPVPPDYELKGRLKLYSRAPRLLFPVFCIDSSRRVLPEWFASYPRWSDRLHEAVRTVKRVASAPASPALMRRRIESMRRVDFAEGEPVLTPTLILVGECGLDRTMAPEASRRYCTLVKQAEVRTLDCTGHLGSVTRPDAFAAEIGAFVDRTNEIGSSREPRTVAL